MKPLVSIIMPTYKGGKNLLMAIEGAINQTYEQIEIIIVDDNGEGTQEQINTEIILSKYIANNDITYIKHKKNINGSAARNTGMKAAKGQYFSFLDDDDFYYPDKIEKQIEIFKKSSNQYGLVCCSGFVLKSTGYGYKLDIVEDDILYNLLCGKLRFNSSMIMISREVFEETGGFDIRYRRHQDWEFCCRILSKFEGKILPLHLVAKYTTSRNNPENPEMAVNYREFFLKENAEIIASLGKKREKKVIAYHYRSLSLAYILKKNYEGAVFWLKKSGNLVVQFFKLCNYVIKIKTVHKEKYACSIEERLMAIDNTAKN